MSTKHRFHSEKVVLNVGRSLFLAALLLQPTGPITALARILQQILAVLQNLLTFAVPIGVLLAIVLVGAGVMRKDLPRLLRAPKPQDNPELRITFGELVKNHLQFFYVAAAFLAIGGCSLASGIVLGFARSWAVDAGIFIFTGGE